MARYTPEQVMAAVHRLADRDTGAALSASTAVIARECRKFAGHDEWRKGTSDVAPVLAELVAAGKLVTYKRSSQWGRRTTAGEVEAYAHIAWPSNHTDRFYATPENADRIKRAQAEAAEERRRADAAADRLEVALAGRRVPPGWGVRVRGAKVHLTLTAEGAEQLAARLKGED